MLDIRYIREKPEEVRARLALKGEHGGIEELLKLDAGRRALIEETDRLKARRNMLSRDISLKAKAGQDAAALKD